MAGEIARAFVRITPNSTGFQSSLMRQTSGVGSAVGSAVGKGIAAGIGVTVAAAGIGLAVATKLAVGFDRSMRNVNSIAQLSEKSFQKLNKQVLDLAAASGTGPTDIANGLYDVVSSGFKASDALKILKASTKGARAGLTDVATSTKVVTAVLNAYHLKATDAAKVTDQLFQTVNVGVLTFEQLASQIGDVLPFASSLGVGLDQVGASIATMTKEGINAAEATTRLKAVLTQMLSPSKDLSARFKDLGFDSGEAMIRSKGLQGALDILAASTHGSKAEMAKLFPDVRSLGGALALTGDNSKGAAKDLKALRDSSGATDRAFKEQAKSISQQWQTMVAKLQVIGIRIGVHVFPLLKIGIDELGRFVGFVDKEIQKISGPTLSGKPLSLKVKAAIVWQDVQPTLDTAAAALWAQIQAGAGAAFQKVVGTQTIDVPITPGIKTPAGGAAQVFPLVVKPQITVEDTDTAGPLHTWWEKNVKPVIDDLGKTGGKDGGKSFVSSFGASVSSEVSQMGKGFADLFVTGPLQILDGALRGDAKRIGKGFMTELGGAFRASGLGIVKDALMSVIGNDIKNALSTAGSLAVSGSATIGRKIASGVTSGLSFLSRLPGTLWGKISSAISSAASHDVSGTFRKMGGTIITGIVHPLSGLAGKALSAISRALSTASSFDASGLFTSIGTSIVTGIASGITSAGSFVSNAVSTVINDAKSLAAKLIGKGSPARVWAAEIGRPMAEGVAVGFEAGGPRIHTAVHKTLKAALNSATKAALVDAKANMLSLASGLTDQIGQVIDAQTAKAIAPLQKRLLASQKAGASDSAARDAATNAASQADIRQQLASATRGPDETNAQFLDRMKGLQQQLGDLAQQAEDAQRAAQEQTLQDQIDGIQTAADARKAAITKNVQDLAAEFNAGKITGAQFTKALTEILKANKVDVASAGQLLGFAFSQAFSAQLNGVTKQIAAISAVIGAKGGGAGHAGFDVSVTDPRDVVKQQIKDAKAALKQDQKDLRDAHKTKDKKDDVRAKAQLDHDRKMLRVLEGMLKFFASQPGSGTVNVNMSAGVPSIEALLAEIFGGAAR